MSDFVLYSMIIATTVSLVLYIIRIWTHRKYLKLPGPTGLPIVGCIHKMDKRFLHLTLDAWAYEYGDMYKFSLFGKTILVVNSSQTARELFLKEPFATLTSDRSSIFAQTYIMENEDVILSKYSEELKYRRKITHQVLKVYGEGLRQIESQLSMSLNTILHHIKETEDKIVDPSDFIDEFLLANLEVLMIGRSGNKRLQRSMKEMDETFNYLMTPSIQRLLTQFPYLRYFGYFQKVLQQLYQHRDELMDTLHNTAKQYPDCCGIYQNLLKIVKEDEKKEHKKITHKNVVVILHDLISAGYMTTRGSLLSVVKMLMSRKDVQLRIQEEIDRVVESDRLPRLNDRESCPYTEATILEILRYISHTPLTGHASSEFFDFQGVRFPKNTTIFVNTWHIHHTENEWDRPMEFIPERFLDDNGKLLEATHTIRKRFATFSYGKRSCLGEVFAKSRIFLFLSSLMQKYTVYPTGDRDVPLFDPRDMKPGVVLLPTDFKCKFIPRM